MLQRWRLRASFFWKQKNAWENFIKVKQKAEIRERDIDKDVPSNNETVNKYMYSSSIPRKQRCSIGGEQLITWPQNELFILRIQKDSTIRYIWLWQSNIYERALIKTYRG